MMTEAKMPNRPLDLRKREIMYDPRTGAPINSSLANYVVAVNADTPEIDVTFLGYPDFCPKHSWRQGSW
jgi:hypothetical protein